MEEYNLQCNRRHGPLMQIAPPSLKLWSPTRHSCFGDDARTRSAKQPRNLLAPSLKLLRTGRVSGIDFFPLMASAERREVYRAMHIFYTVRQKDMAHICIVTGLSGAGKSTVLRALEDFGFFCVDNLPLALIPAFSYFIRQSNNKEQKIALGIDVRSGQAVEELVEQVHYLKQESFQLTILFLTASVPVLLKRFQETRRKHPLADGIDLLDAIETEKQLLQPLSQQADISIDTDQLNIHELRDFIRSAVTNDKKPVMVVNLTSFGFKYGVPVETNFVFDIRSLPNPYFVPQLTDFTGKDAPVQEYLFGLEPVKDYFQKLHDFFIFSLKKSYEEGRFFIHVAIGCTGGKHRSVAFVEKLAELSLDNIQFIIKHRDIAKK